MGRPFKSIEELIRGAIDRGAAKNGGDQSLKRDGSKIIFIKCTEAVNFCRDNISSRVNDHLKSDKQS